MTYAVPVHLILAGRVLADSSNGPGAGLGLVVFLVLLVGCIFLFRSMSGRIKRLPASFGPPPPASPETQPPDEDPKPQ
ncbi:MAG: hypothetical protein QOJ11_918 [Frankiales bacterium]|nr:hypothetical protein [Frankiales bacterium]